VLTADAISLYGKKQRTLVGIAGSMVEIRTGYFYNSRYYMQGRIKSAGPQSTEKCGGVKV
jgi:hypothetical protein